MQNDNTSQSQILSPYQQAASLPPANPPKKFPILTVIFGGESNFSVYEFTFIKEGSGYYLSTIRPLMKDVSTKI